MIQKLLADIRVRKLLERILSAIIIDKKEKEEPWKKLQEAIPKELIGSLDHERVDGSPLVWAGGTQPYVMNVETGKHIKDWGMTKKDIQAFVKEIKAKVNELNGTTAAREAELAKNAEVKKAKQEEKEKKKAEAEAAAKAAEEAKKAAEEEARKKAEEEAKRKAEEAKRVAIQRARKKCNFGSGKAIEAFNQQCGLNALGENQTKSVWCSEKNWRLHRDGNTYKHHEQFNDISETEYLERAKALADKPIDGKNVWGYACYSGYNQDGTICRYDVKTHEYVKMNNRGLITYYILEAISGKDEDIHQRFFNYVWQDGAKASKTEP